MYKKINTAEPQRSVGPVYTSWTMQHPHFPSKVQSEGAPKGGLASPQSHSWDPGSAEQSGLLEAGGAGTLSQVGKGTPPSADCVQAVGVSRRMNALEWVHSG